MGGNYDPDGPWQGGWMELVAGAETMALDAARLAPRPAADARHDDRATSARIYYYVVWPRRSCRSTRTTCSSTG